ncbi:AAA family ATPase [Kribbella sp. NPDC026611]|uniref:helix-turn-helix transcriptional regulator n=1 Tax=Kribbella sp. NPDC026611 TaxID=3154911 RepID=UPI00340A60DC
MRVTSPYVGREAELAVLRSAAGQVEAGDSARLLVVGEAGIGKTRLIAEFTAGLGAEWLTVTGACPELGAEHFPYVAFLPIVRRLADGSPASPALRSLLPHGSADDSPESTGGRLALLYDLIALIERAAADRPLVLVVEDLHWADSASRELFGYLARNLGKLPVLLIGTVRTGELPAGHPVRQLVAELGRRSDITMLPLEPLEQHDVGELLTALDGRYDPVRASAVYRRSGGNPLFVEALVHDSSPRSSLRTLLQERVAGLSDTARPVLAVASIAGASMGHDLLTVLADRPDDELDRALRELVEREQLVPTAYGYQFRHALIREAVYTGLLPGERRRLHARAASALSEHPDLAAQGLPAAELAEHWYLAGNADEAYDAALVAADEARATFAYGEEFRHLERALALRPATDPARLELLERAITAAMRAGEGARGLELCAAALELVDEVADPERAALLLLDRAQLRSRLDLTGREDIDRARRLLPTDQETYALGRLHWVLGIDEGTARHTDAAQEHGRTVLRIGEALDDDRLRCRAYAVLGYAAYMADDLEAAWDAQARCRRIATAINDDFVLVANSLWECATLNAAGQFERLAAHMPGAVREAELLGMRKWRGPLMTVNLALALTAVGRWDEAVHAIEEELAAGPETLYETVLRGQLASLHLYRGDLARAAELLPVADELYARSPVLRSFMQGYLTSLTCELAIARHDPEAAVPAAAEFLQHALDPDGPQRPDLDGLLGIAMLQRARLAAAARNREIAADVASIRASVAELLPQVGTTAAPPLAAYVATISAALGPGRMADWDTAADHWRRMPYLPGTIACLIAAAEAALAISNRPGARRRLEEARELATPLRAGLYLDRIAALGQRARLEPAASSTDVMGLTPRELDVLRLLARGLLNREIAAELYISPATVAVHVSRILTKLDATTRTEATAQAHTLRLLD